MRILKIENIFHQNKLCYNIILETISTPHLYRTLNTCNLPNNINIDDNWIYKHDNGDTIHFDYCLKSKLTKYE